MTEEEIADWASRHDRAKAWARERWPWTFSVNYVKGKAESAVYEARGQGHERLFRADGESFVEEP